MHDKIKSKNKLLSPFPPGPAEGRRIRSTDPNQHSTWFGYDAAGQLVATTNALGHVVRFQYDLVGNRTNIIDARGNALGFRFDPLHRLTNLVYAVNDAERFAYDPVGNLTNYTARSGDQIRYEYDPANRLTNKLFLGTSQAIRYAHDPLGRLTNVTWLDGQTLLSQVRFQYDPLGRVTNETQIIGSAPARTVRYEYDPAGRKTKMIYPDGSFLTYAYNPAGWLTNISDSAGSTIVAYAYDAAGRRTKRTLANGTEPLYQYDNAGQMTNILHRKADQSTISRYAYGYDDAGRRTWVLRANGRGDVFRYDATDQLTNVLYEALNPDTSPSGWTNEARYAFDPAGNRTSVTLTNSGTVNYTANALNQYTAVGSTTPTYDANGNLTFDGRWYYTYDRENRLMQAANDQMTVTYRYDAFNRLIERAVGAGVTRFYYDDRWRLIAEYDGNDALVRKYVYGPEVDEPVRLTRSGTNYYYHAAALGTVTEITDATGNLVERYSYDVYGEPTIWDGSGSQISNSQIGNRLLFQGRDRDPATGLYNFRNRYYSPSLGRFVQVDPIHVRGGLNLYRFGKNGPSLGSDPFGLWRFQNCSPEQEAKIRAGLIDACEKARAKDCFKCLSRGKQIAMDRMCEDKSIGLEEITFVCHDRNNTPECEGRDGYSYPESRKSHLRLPMSHTPGCAALHEAAHSVGGVGNDSNPSDKDYDSRAFDIMECAGCPRPPGY